MESDRLAYGGLRQEVTIEADLDACIARHAALGRPVGGAFGSVSVDREGRKDVELRPLGGAAVRFAGVARRDSGEDGRSPCETSQLSE